MQTVLLAAGRGTRMRPLTDHRPKPLLPVADRPLLAHVADAAIDAGATRLVVVVGVGGDQVRSALGERYRGTPIAYVDQGTPRGTADAVRAATPALDPEPFAVFNGDVLVEPGAIGPLFQDGPAVLAVRVPDPRSYGVFETEGGDRVTGVVEKPADPPSNLANAGGYVFPAAAQEYLEEVTESERGEYELTDVLERVCAERHVRCVAVDRWLDVGRPWELLAANEWKLGDVAGERSGTVHDGATLSGTVAVEPGASIHDGAVVEGPVFVGADATIGPSAHVRGPTLVGPESRVGHAAAVIGSVVSAGTVVGHAAYLNASVVGRDVTLRSGTATAARRPDGEPVRMTVKGESVSTDRETFGAIIGDGATAAVNTSLSPGIVLGTDRRTAPGESLTADRR